MTRRRTVRHPRAPLSRDAGGYTLVELAIALASFGIIVIGILALWQQTQGAYFVSSEQGEIQGDARVAIDQMTRDFTKAGRDVLQCAFDSEAYTQCSGAKLLRCQALPSLGGSFTCTNTWIIPVASSTGSALTIQVQMDLDANGAINTSAPSEESVTYAWASVTKQLTRQQGTGTPRVLADNIESLLLTFWGRPPVNGVCTGAWAVITPVSQTDRDCIQSIAIDLVAGGQVGQFGGTGVTTVRRTLRTSVDLRTR